MTITSLFTLNSYVYLVLYRATCACVCLFSYVICYKRTYALAIISNYNDPLVNAMQCDLIQFTTIEK